jgi:aquaporin NIP
MEEVSPVKKYVAELTGTFALVFCGTGAIIIDQQSGGLVSHVGVAVTFGLVIMCMIYSLGNISGAHLNPAVSIAFTLAGRFPISLLPGYIISQLAGALLASFTLKFLFESNQLLGATIPSGPEMQSFVLELILTFFLMLVIINVADGSKEQGLFAGLAIGAIVGLEAMFAGPVCGASMNPARSIAPAIVSGHLEHLWIYIIAPITGAALAIPVCKYLNSNTKQLT